jgi:hypothetical protein
VGYNGVDFDFFKELVLGGPAYSQNTQEQQEKILKLAAASVCVASRDNDPDYLMLWLEREFVVLSFFCAVLCREDVKDRALRLRFYNGP